MTDSGITAVGVSMSSDPPKAGLSVAMESNDIDAHNPITVASAQPTEQERQKIEAIVRISKNSVLFPPDNSTGFFD
jgi:hypothetical protein